MNGKTRINLFPLLLIITALGLYLSVRSFKTNQAEATASRTPKYIFIFLADGAGITHLEIARLYSRHIHQEGLTISDRIMKEGSLGLLTTHSADLLVTDSAAAGTALASGCKTKKMTVGICQDGSAPKTVLELAKEKGMRIGLVTNSRIYDASPAAFASHASSRNHYSSIVNQYLELEPDLLLGGGRDQFLPRSQKGSRRKDNRDLITLFKERGYAYVSNKKDLTGAKGPKVLGLFSLQDMSLEINRDKKTEPSVYDMTQAAIRILQEGNRTGFLVFIESEHIDSAAHLSNVAALIYDFREFDRAVGLAYNFYKKHPRETLLLVTSDHETGGLSFTRGASPDDLKRIRSITSWSTSGHTSQPVFVGALGVGSERFRGYQDNTDFAKHLFALLQGKKSD
ncbi:MAG: alkaline phosphatase [Candidatus Binatia bacterium]